jgi:glycerophosphoryl diester phosphodiesterase
VLRTIIIAVASLTLLIVVLLALPQSGPWKIPLLDTTAIEIERPPIETKRPNPDIIKIGHRGSTIFAPENTLPAIEKAIELGFEYVEIDVRYTSDGVPILLHDDELDRTTDGSGRVAELTLEEIQQYDAGSWFSDEFVGTRVPALEEALAIMQGRICVYWDTKELPDKATIELFKSYGFNRDCLLIAISGVGHVDETAIPREIIDYWPDAPLVPSVITLDELTAALDDFPNSRAVSIPSRHLSPELVDAAHAEGLLVVTDTLGQADRALTYKKVIDAGVDIFMLAYIDSFYTYLETGNIDTPIPNPPKNAEYLPENRK